MIGFINCYKPQGVSSAYVVNKIKKATKTKCGHLGTLDPNATGVLPIALGKATRFFDYFLKKDKVYKAICEFGILTTTLDPEGEVVKNEEVDVSFEQIQEHIGKFIGKIMQIPPLYSAKSIGGKRAYEYAKQNIDITLEPRKVEIFEFKCLKKLKKNTYEFLIHCSAGTYVRSLLLDLATAIGTVGTTIAIDRQKSGIFEIDKAVALDDIVLNPNKYIMSVEEVLPDKKVVNVDYSKFKALVDGKTISADNVQDLEVLIKYDGKIVCLAELNNGRLKSKIHLYMEEE